jgi:hypothetical protein
MKGVEQNGAEQKSLFSKITINDVFGIAGFCIVISISFFGLMLE